MRNRIKNSTELQANTTAKNIAIIIKKLRQENATLEQLEEALQKLLYTAFDKIEDGESKLPIYLILEEKMQPEALQELLDAESLAWLKQINGLHAAQKYLASSEIKPSLVKKFLADPVPFISDTLSLNIELNRIETSNSVTSDQLARADRINKQLAALPAGLSQIHRLNSNLNRYFEPLRIISKLIKVLILLPLIVSLLLIYRFKNLTKLLLLDKAIGGLINSISDSNFEAEKQFQQEQQVDRAREAFLDSYRMANENLLEMNDSEVIAYLSQESLRTFESYEEMLNEQINASLVPRGWELLKIAASSIFDKLSEPLPPTTDAKIKAIVAWPLRFLATIPLLLVTGIAESINHLADLVILTGTAGLALFTSATLLVINTPLIIWDTPGFIYHKIRNTFARAVERQVVPDEIVQQQTEQKEPSQEIRFSRQSSYKRMKRLLPAIIEENKHDIDSSPCPSPQPVSFATAAPADTLLSESKVTPATTEQDRAARSALATKIV